MASSCQHRRRAPNETPGRRATGAALYIANGLLPDGDFAVRVLRGSILARAEVFPADAGQKTS